MVTTNATVRAFLPVSEIAGKNQGKICISVSIREIVTAA
jgi:hypothetical protein